MENLKEIRNELLRLHKTLMEIERENYEAQEGKVSNMQLLNLLFEHENFIWLRDISMIVAEIDEMFAAKTGIDMEMAETLFFQAHSLFDESERHPDFKSRYQINLDLESKVEVHHHKLQEFFKRKKA